LETRDFPVIAQNEKHNSVDFEVI